MWSRVRSQPNVRSLLEKAIAELEEGNRVLAWIVEVLRGLVAVGVEGEEASLLASAKASLDTGNIAAAKRSIEAACRRAASKLLEVMGIEHAKGCPGGGVLEKLARLVNLDEGSRRAAALIVSNCVSKGKALGNCVDLAYRYYREIMVAAETLGWSAAAKLSSMIVDEQPALLRKLIEEAKTLQTVATLLTQIMETAGTLSEAVEAIERLRATLEVVSGAGVGPVEAEIIARVVRGPRQRIPDLVEDVAAKLNIPVEEVLKKLYNLCRINVVDCYIS